MKNKLALIVPLLLFAVAVGVAYKMIKENRTLPVYTPAMINPELVDESVRGERVKHRISDFELIDQDGNTFDQTKLEGKYYVTDFFFTTCPNICIDMSAQLQRVQNATTTNPEFMIVSHTVQPEIDSAEVLKSYAELHEADPNKWVFLTGDKRIIYDLARKSYFAATTDGDGGVDDFIHTENFVLVDKEKRIRGFYDGTSQESVDQLIEDISILSQEYED